MWSLWTACRHKLQHSGWNIWYKQPFFTTIRKWIARWTAELLQFCKLTNSMQSSPSWEATTCWITKNFSTFYGTCKFITMFTRALHWSLSWLTSIQTIPPHPISLRSLNSQNSLLKADGSDGQEIPRFNGTQNLPPARTQSNISLFPTTFIFVSVTWTLFFLSEYELPETAHSISLFSWHPKSSKTWPSSLALFYHCPFNLWIKGKQVTLILVKRSFACFWCVCTSACVRPCILVSMSLCVYRDFSIDGYLQLGSV
jgi:hypothetical protein